MTVPLLRAKHSKKVVAAEIAALLPTPYGRFVDAAVTDAAVFAAQPRTPSRCLLNTTDPELHTLLEALQKSPVEVVEAAQYLWEDLEREEYESVAASDLPAVPAEAAAQLLYLNQLSQPGTSKYDPGHKAGRLSWDSVTEWAAMLQKVKLSVEEPYERLDSARPTDLVYLDTIAGLSLEATLNVGAESPAQVVVVDSGGQEDITAPDGYTSVTLSRCRPGLRSPDVVYLKSH